jgi:hypothetical protein
MLKWKAIRRRRRGERGGEKGGGEAGGGKGGGGGEGGEEEEEGGEEGGGEEGGGGDDEEEEEFLADYSVTSMCDWLHKTGSLNIFPQATGPVVQVCVVRLTYSHKLLDLYYKSVWFA